jgi:serine protease Do
MEVAMINYRPFYMTIFLIQLLFFACSAPQQTQFKTVNWERYPKDESQIREYLDDNMAQLDPIEGIWTVDSFMIVNNLYRQDHPNYARVAILKDTLSSTRDYIEVVLPNEGGWIVGTITAHFSKTAYGGVYTSKQFNIDGSFVVGNFALDDVGILSHNRSNVVNGNQIYYEQTYLKIFPPIDEYSKIGTDNISSIKSQGSGFLISESGLIITNYHVVDDADVIEILFPSKNVEKFATLVIKDKNNDLAILQLEDFEYAEIFTGEIPFSLADISTIRTGQEVYTLGFPLGSIMGSTSRLSTGRINSLYGIQEDPRLFQISNPLQPGNSGGPLFNLKAELVGVVVSGLGGVSVHCW